MRVIRVIVDRRNEGVRVAVAMSPSLLAEVVENGGDVRFNSISDNDLALELELRSIRWTPRSRRTSSSAWSLSAKPRSTTPTKSEPGGVPR
jgi:hypothetical protein